MHITYLLGYRNMKLFVRNNTIYKLLVLHCLQRHLAAKMSLVLNIFFESNMIHHIDEKIVTIYTFVYMY